VAKGFPAAHLQTAHGQKLFELRSGVAELDGLRQRDEFQQMKLQQNLDYLVRMKMRCSCGTPDCAEGLRPLVIRESGR
jgi:hypothetical protein